MASRASRSMAFCFGVSCLRCRPAARRAIPTGQFLIARLRVEMPMPVEAVNADPLALVTKMLEVVDGRSRSAAAIRLLPLASDLGLVDELPLLRGADQNLARPSALGPGILEHQSIATIRPLRDDLDRFLSPQPERALAGAARCWMHRSGMCSIACDRRARCALQMLVTYTRSGMP
mgnify:CR=1 FL=1